MGPEAARGPAAFRRFLEAYLVGFPDYVEARYNLGQAYVLQKQPDLAITEFNEILRVQPDFEPARRGLAQARQLKGP